MHNSLRYFYLTIASIGFTVSPAAAQVVPDNTLGAENSRVSRDQIGGLESDRIDGGAIRGSNLFHSFERFNVGEGRGVYFSNPVGIDSIFGRVTGSDVSNILGRLGVIGTADLYLINPNGIVFGENASLDVSGSFTATTSNAIQFGDRGVFDASSPTVPSSLLTIHPSAYLFNQPNVGSIINRASTPVDSTSELSFGLFVPPAETLTLLGGDVRLDGGSLTALSGRIEIGAIDDVGRVQVNPNGRLIFPNDLDRADFSLTNSGIITTLGAGGGTIQIHADRLTITQGTIAAGIAPGLGSATAQAGDVVLDATGRIRIDQSSGIGNEVLSSRRDGIGNGNSGNIIIRGSSLLIRDSVLSASTFGQGNSGTVRINVPGEVHLQNSRIVTGVSETGFGQTGDIQITAGGQVSTLR